MAGTPDATAGPPAGGPGRARFIVGSADPAVLATLPPRLEGREGIRVDRVLRTASGVGGVVVEATPQAVDQLRAELGPGVVIEEDRPIDPINPVDPFTQPGGPSSAGPGSGAGPMPPGCF